MKKSMVFFMFHVFMFHSHGTFATIMRHTLTVTGAAIVFPSWWCASKMRLMWGNRLGWILAVVVLALEAVAVWAFSSFDFVSAPSKFSQNAEYLAPLNFPLAASSVVPSMTRSDDTGATYREAIKEVLAHREEYDTFLEKGKDSDIPGLRAIYLLQEAAPSLHAKVFSDSPSQVINYDAEKPRLEALLIAGRAALRAGLLVQKAHPQEGQTHFEAAFSLGWKLYEERLSDAELSAGMELLGQAAAALQRLAESSKDASRAAQLQQFNQTRVQFYESRIKPVRRVLISIDPNVIAASVGDYFYFAHHAKDRVWKTEAILAIGRLQYYVGEGGRAANQTGARKELNRLVNDPDPITKAAATAARDLTIEQYRVIR
jgi:hypothetical protein